MPLTWPTASRLSECQRCCRWTGTCLSRCRCGVEEGDQIRGRARSGCLGALPRQEPRCSREESGRTVRTVRMVSGDVWRECGMRLPRHRHMLTSPSAHFAALRGLTRRLLRATSSSPRVHSVPADPRVERCATHAACRRRRRCALVVYSDWRLLAHRQMHAPTVGFSAAAQFLHGASVPLNSSLPRPCPRPRPRPPPRPVSGGHTKALRLCHAVFPPWGGPGA